MMNIGIDAISFYAPQYFLPLEILAKARQVDPKKYSQGLGQHCMAVLAPDEDIVTLATNAAARLLRNTQSDDIDLLLFATESSIDQSKAAGIFVHGLLKLSEHCRVIELKQACYSGTFALQTAISFIQTKKANKVLLIAADVARYGLGSVGESSQGAGAVALLIAPNPKILVIEPESSFLTLDTMDFFRPNYKTEAIVDGHYSCALYLNMLKKTWQAYQEKTQRHASDFAAFCLHIPVPRLVEKAYDYLRPQGASFYKDALLHYSRAVGNCYSASLFLGLCSMLEQCHDDFSGKILGCYSYGSGCSAEFFSGIVQDKYKDYLDTAYHEQMLFKRVELNIKSYEQYYAWSYPTDGSHCVIPLHTHCGYYRLAQLTEHRRHYELSLFNGLNEHHEESTKYSASTLVC